MPHCGITRELFPVYLVAGLGWRKQTVATYVNRENVILLLHVNWQTRIRTCERWGVLLMLSRAVSPGIRPAWYTDNIDLHARICLTCFARGYKTCLCYIM